MHRFFNFIYYWVPPFTWMSAIFYMSSQKSVASGVNLVVDFVTFKSLHIIEYALLFLLLYRAFHSLIFLNKKFLGLCAFPVAIIYSFTDEFHQLSIPTRSGQVRDIVFDIVGMLIMYGIIKKVPLIRKIL